MKHKIKSEITNKKGAYTQPALDFSEDFITSIKKVMEKHKGKMSIMAMENIMMNCVITQSTFNTIMDIVN